MSHTFIFVGTILGGLWGLLTLIALFYNDAKCIVCRHYGPKEYMIPVDRKKYKHIGCS